MDSTIIKKWTDQRSALLVSNYCSPSCSRGFVSSGLKTTTSADNKADKRLLSTLLSAGLWNSLYPQRNNPALSQLVAKTIEEKVQKQYTTLLSMFPCVKWLKQSEWIYNPLFKHALVTLQSVVNELAQSPTFQKTYQDSDIEGREYQRPIADIDEASSLSLSEYAYPVAMRLQRIMSGEALVTMQRAKTKRTVGRLLLLDASHSMVTGVDPNSKCSMWSDTNIQRWVYALAVIIDSLNNLQSYGGVLYCVAFSNHITDFGQITVDNAVQWLADEIKPFGTWMSDSSAEFIDYATKTLSAMSADDLELVVVTDGEIPVPAIDLGVTKCHVFGMATDNDKLQALTVKTGGVYIRLDRL